MKANEPLPDWARELPLQIMQEASRFIIGKQDVVKNLLVALLADGHVDRKSVV